jgi:hypothetical protein
MERIVVIPAAVQSVSARGNHLSSGALPAANETLGRLFHVFPELKRIPNGLFDYKEILHPDRKGSFETGDNRFKVKLMRAVGASVMRLLKEGEKVIGVGAGSACYPARLACRKGAPAMVYTRCAILSTRKRLLLVNVESKRTPPVGFDRPRIASRGLKKGLNHFQSQGKHRFTTVLEHFKITRPALSGKTRAAMAS